VRPTRAIIAIAALAAAAGALAGCRAEEQGRALIYDKGTYAGPKDPALTPKQIDELNARVMMQGGTNAGIAPGAPPPPVRASESKSQPVPPPASKVNEVDLNRRLRQQFGN